MWACWGVPTAARRRALKIPQFEEACVKEAVRLDTPISSQQHLLPPGATLMSLYGKEINKRYISDLQTSVVLLSAIAFHDVSMDLGDVNLKG